MPAAMKLLGLCGSLRAASLNAALLRCAVHLAPPHIELQVFAGMGELALFNPDLESAVPASVQALRSAVAEADALLIASPEYAHGVSGIIKNALDWLVSCEAFVDKPVAVLNASPRAHHADAALRETLKTMSARIVEDASVCVPLLGSGLTEEAMHQSPAIAGAVQSALAALYASVVLQQSDQGPAFPLPR